MEYSSPTGWLLLVAECLLPPVIAYGLLLGVFRVVRWVVTGFKPTTSTP
jgi:hypothetical protein